LAILEVQVDGFASCDALFTAPPGDLLAEAALFSEI
jgi:hypothetical protein